MNYSELDCIRHLDSLPMRKHLPAALNLSCFAVIMAVIYSPLAVWSMPIALVGWYLLLGPVTVYATSERPPSNAAFEVLPADAVTKGASDEWARWAVEQLAGHGFVPRARYRLRTPAPFDFGQRLDNASTGEVAVIIVGWQTPEVGPATPIRVAVFHTRFRDGGELVTTNSPLPSSTPDLPGDISYRLPDVTDLNTLYSVHRRLVKADGRRPKPIVLSEDPLSWELDRNQRGIAIQVAHGLGVRDEKAGVLRLTLKGTLRATWLFHPWFTRMHDRRSTATASAALRAVTT